MTAKLYLLLVAWTACVTIIITLCQLLFIPLGKIGKGRWVIFKILKNAIKAKDKRIAESAISVIFMMLVAIIGIICVSIAFANTYGIVAGIISLLPTVLVISLTIYLMRGEI